MEIRQLEYFIAAAETKSFHKAGQTLFVSQPAVSKAIGKLEQEMGASLFERTSRGLRLTGRGSALYHYAKNILQQVHFINGLDRVGEDFLSLASYPSLRLANILTKFYLTQPNLQLDYREGTVQDIIELVYTGVSQFGIVYISPNQEDVLGHILGHKNLEFVSIREAALCVYVGEKSPHWVSPQEMDVQTMGELSYIRGVRDFFSVEHHFDYISLNQLDTTHFSEKVLTNSDHLVMTMLEQTDLCYLGIGAPAKNTKGRIAIQSDSTKLTLGYIKPKNGILSVTAEAFIRDFVEAITNGYDIG